MRIDLKVVPKASRNEVRQEEGRLKVYVTSAPEKNRANKTVIELIAAHFGIRKTDVRIIKGLHASSKVIEIP